MPAPRVGHARGGPGYAPRHSTTRPWADAVSGMSGVASEASGYDEAMGQERMVSCPSCKGPSLYSLANVWRPFCSERCRQHDLGAWASEDYRVATQAPPEDLVDDPPPAH